MTLEQIVTDITAVLGAIGVISSVLAHLPLPARYAQFFARLATYAANAKFSVNQRDTLPKPPCDPTTLATITAECSVQAFECGRQGIPKAECAAIADCNARLDERAKGCRK